MFEELMTHLRTCTVLTINNGLWILGEFEVDADEVFEVWDEVRATISRVSEEPLSVKRVITWSSCDQDPTYSFLSDMHKLEDLIFYDAMNDMDDLSGVRGHAHLRRIAFTDYCGLYEPSDFSWLDTLPQLEELIYFTNYLDLHDPELEPSTWRRLESLWTTMDTFKVLDHTLLSGLKRLTLDSCDVDEVLESEQDQELAEAMKQAFEALVVDGPCEFRVEIAGGDDQKQEKARAIFGSWIPDPSQVEWVSHTGQLLSHATFLNAPPLFDESTGMPHEV